MWKTLPKKAKKEQEERRHVVFLRVRRGRTAQQPVSGKNTRREQRFSKSFSIAGKSKFAVWKKVWKIRNFRRSFNPTNFNFPARKMRAKKCASCLGVYNTYTPKQDGPIFVPSRGKEKEFLFDFCSEQKWNKFFCSF